MQHQTNSIFCDFFYVVVLKCDCDDIFENGRIHKLRSCVAENPSELLLEALVQATAGGNVYLRISNKKLFWIFLDILYISLVRATAGGNDIKQTNSLDIFDGYFGYFGYFWIPWIFLLVRATAGSSFYLPVSNKQLKSLEIAYEIRCQIYMQYAQNC